MGALCPRLAKIACLGLILFSSLSSQVAAQLSVFTLGDVDQTVLLNLIVPGESYRYEATVEVATPVTNAVVRLPLGSTCDLTTNLVMTTDRRIYGRHISLFVTGDVVFDGPYQN